MAESPSSNAPGATYSALRYGVLFSRMRGGWLLWDRREGRAWVQPDGRVRVFVCRDDAHSWLVQHSAAGAGPAWETCRLPAGHRDPPIP